MQIKLKTPSIKHLAKIITAIKPQIDDDCREEPDQEPMIQLTIGCDETGWDYQSGDNSYAGGAYGYAYWGVGYITRRCNARETAKEIIADAWNQVS